MGIPSTIYINAMMRLTQMEMRSEFSASIISKFYFAYFFLVAAHRLPGTNAGWFGASICNVLLKKRERKPSNKPPSPRSETFSEHMPPTRHPWFLITDYL
jgi:hypothetical protein